MTGNMAVPTLAYSFLAELSASPEAGHLWLARTLVILAVIGAVIFAVAIVRGVRNAPEHLRYKACHPLSIPLAWHNGSGHRRDPGQYRCATVLSVALAARSRTA